MDIKPSSSPHFLVQAAAFEAGLVFLASLLGWMLGQPPSATFQWNVGSLFWGVVATLPLLAMFWLCRRLPWTPLAEMRTLVEKQIVPMFQGSNGLDLAGIAFLAGVGEELLFRGVLQASLADWFARWLPHQASGVQAASWMAVVGAAVIFGLMHAVTLGYALFATVMGLYLGWLWMVSGNIAVPIVTHALYDFVALTYLIRSGNFRDSDPPAAEPTDS